MAYSRQEVAFINNAQKIVSDFRKKIDLELDKMNKIDDEYKSRAATRKEPHQCKIETYAMAIDLWNRKMREKFGLDVEGAVKSLTVEDMFACNPEEETQEAKEESIKQECESDSESFNWQEKILG